MPEERVWAPCEGERERRAHGPRQPLAAPRKKKKKTLSARATRLDSPRIGPFFYLQSVARDMWHTRMALELAQSRSSFFRRGRFSSIVPPTARHALGLPLFFSRSSPFPPFPLRPARPGSDFPGVLRMCRALFLGRVAGVVGLFEAQREDPCSPAARAQPLSSLGSDQPFSLSHVPPSASSLLSPPLPTRHSPAAPWPPPLPPPTAAWSSRPPRRPPPLPPPPRPPPRRQPHRPPRPPP